MTQIVESKDANNYNFCWHHHHEHPRIPYSKRINPSRPQTRDHRSFNDLTLTAQQGATVTVSPGR